MGYDGSKLQSSNIWCSSDEPSTDVAECRRKVASGRKVVGAMKSLYNARGLQYECASVLQEVLLVPVFCITERP